MALPLSAHVLCLVKGCLGTGLVTLSTLPRNQGNVLSPWTMARVGLQSAPPCKSVGAVPSVQMSSCTLSGIWERNLPVTHESPDTGICPGRHLPSPTLFLHCAQTGHVSWKPGVLGIKQEFRHHRSGHGASQLGVPVTHLLPPPVCSCSGEWA